MHKERERERERGAKREHSIAATVGDLEASSQEDDHSVAVVM